MNNFEYIKSKDNQTIKFISKLQTSSAFRFSNNMFVIEGLRLCLDAVKNNFGITYLVVNDDYFNKHYETLEQISAERKIKVPDSLFFKMSDTKNPQGILCVCNIPEYYGKIPTDVSGKLVVLENLQDPGNLGAVSRTAEAFSIDGIIINGGCDPFSPKSLRASMGALIRIKVYFSENLPDDIDTLKQNGFKVYATVPTDFDKKIGEISFDKNCAVLIGNEANGLSETAKSISDFKITIPMSGKAESLNAAAAASIVMWEMVK